MFEPDVLGDVHLGKTFVEGVPLNRRGEREEMVWAEFRERVMNPKSSLHVQVGDLFDSFSVPEMVVLRAARIYKEGAAQNPNVRYVINRGNHDASRDIGKASSFDLFAEIMEGHPRITVVKEVDILVDHTQGAVFGVMPWHPFKSAEVLAQELGALYHERHLDAVFTHCDLESFGGSVFNVLPVEELCKITNKIYNGHVHLPGQSTVHGLTLINTGSMQPYSHAEDPTHRLYITLTLEQLIVTEVSKRNVRVLLKPGESLPTDLDCLSLTAKQVSEKPDEEPDISVAIEDFNLGDLMRKSLTSNKVGSTVADKIMAKFEESRNAA